MVARASTKRQEPMEDRIKPVPKPVSGTDTVVVGCKLPNGIILRTFEMVKQTRVIGGASGSVFTENMAEVKERFTVRGPALPFGMIPNIPISGGYALTMGVPRGLCELWFQQNKEADCVRNQLIFWEPDADRATARARELQKTRSGLEPLDPNNIPATFAKGTVGLSGIQKADLSDSDTGKAIAGS